MYKKIITILIIILSITSVFSCVSFLDFGNKFYIFTEVKPEFQNKLYYNSSFYTNDQIKELYDTSNISVLDRDKIDIVSFREDLISFNANCSRDTPECREVLNNNLDLIYKLNTTYLLQNDVDEIVNVGKNKQIIIKYPSFKFGPFEFGERKWKSYYDSTCYRVEDVRESTFIIFGKDVHYFVVFGLIIILVSYLRYRKKAKK